MCAVGHFSDGLLDRILLRPRIRHIAIKTLFPFLLLAGLSFGQEKIDFARTIRPILNTHCVACHGGVTAEGGVSFIYRDQVLATGDSGNPTVVPFKPEESELIYRITTDDLDDRMPQPDHGEKLNDGDIALISQWIKEGAEWANHWSFEKPEAHPAPEVSNPSWPQNKVDFFTLAKMDEAGLNPASPADDATLLRRLSLDITGLPPTVAELDAFDASDISSTVERLLGSPAFGEKWASMWLDAARYADSEGLGMDKPRTVWPYRDWVVRALNSDMPYPEFIRKQIAGDLLPDPSLDDLVATTFHRLTQANSEGGTSDEEFRVAAVMDRVATTWESIHGLTFACAQCHDHPYEPLTQDDYYSFMAFFNNTRDLDRGNHAPTIRVPSREEDYPEMNQRRKAHAAAQKNYFAAAQKVVKQASWHKVSDFELSSKNTQTEIVSTDGYAEIRTKGTIAQNTRFEISISQKPELSELTALRFEVLPPDLEKASHSGVAGTHFSHVEAFYSPSKGAEPVPLALSRVISDESQPFIDPMESLNAKTAQGWGPETHQYRPRHCVITLKEPLNMAPGSKVLIKIHQNARSMTEPLVAKRTRISLSDSPVFQEWEGSSEGKNSFETLAKTRRAMQELPGVNIPVMAELEPHLRRDTRPFARGNWLDKEDRSLAPGTPESLHPLLSEKTEADRLDLANWLASTENPFAARVMVNRVWNQLFGRGLVETLEDFGSSGLPPSHPQLLDDLAVRFQNEMNWSIKALVREMVNSSTYQQSPANPASRAEDPANRFFARGPRNRLDAEAVRDHHLAASGLLKLSEGGTPVYPPLPDGVWTPFKGMDKWPTAGPGDPNRYRRSIYTYYKRSIPFPIFATFDAPTRDICSQRRLRSNTPLAALATLNDTAFVEMADALASRVQKELPDSSIEAKIEAAYRYATSQEGQEEVVAELSRLYQQAEKRYLENPALLAETKVSSEQAALAIVANTILNLDAALTR